MTIKEFISEFSWDNAPKGTYHVKAHTTNGMAHLTDRGSNAQDAHGNSYWGPHSTVPALGDRVIRIDYLTRI